MTDAERRPVPGKKRGPPKGCIQPETTKMASSRINRSKVGHVSPVMRQLFAELDATDHTLLSFADRVGTTAQSMGVWRRGDHSPTIWVVEKLAKALGYRLVLEKIDSPEL